MLLATLAISVEQRRPHAGNPVHKKNRGYQGECRGGSYGRRGVAFRQEQGATCNTLETGRVSAQPYGF